jgi:hypothetical protein
MEDTQDLHHQQQLEEQEKEDGSTSLYMRDEFGHDLHLHCWGSDETVFVTTRDARLSMTLYLSVEHAKALADAIIKAADAADKE